MDGVTNCPSCRKPLSGRECQNCGCNPHEVETVRCVDCGDEVVKKDADNVERSNQVGRITTTDYFCDDCDPEDYYLRG